MTTELRCVLEQAVIAWFGMGEADGCEDEWECTATRAAGCRRCVVDHSFAGQGRAGTTAGSQRLRCCRGSAADGVGPAAAPPWRYPDGAGRAGDERGGFAGVISRTSCRLARL